MVDKKLPGKVGGTLYVRQGRALAHPSLAMLLWMHHRDIIYVTDHYVPRFQYICLKYYKIGQKVKIFCQSQ